MHWINGSVFYHIYPLGFCGAPKQNDYGPATPRIEKLADWIPHLLEMHVNAVYLGPVFESSEHGYDTRDYYAIDRRLGDNETFARVCEKLHENGIRIVLDGVFNHVGRQFWAFEDVKRNGQNSPYVSWFSGLRFDGQSPMGDPFCYDAWQGHYNLVKLNLRHPDVTAHLLDAVGAWIDRFGIDGLRLDAADCVDPGFFKKLRQYCREKRPDFWLMGEIIHGDYNRWANPDMLDSVTNYECRKGLYSSHNDKNYFEIAHSLNRQSGKGGIYQNLTLYTFVDNHDVDRVASLVNTPAHLPNIYTLLYTMPGVPSVYYGSEWAAKGAQHDGSDDDLRPCLSLEPEDWKDAGLYHHICRLGAIRRALPALQCGGYEQLFVKNEQFAFLRAYNGQNVYTALNLSDQPARVEFPVFETHLRDLLSGAACDAANGRLSIVLPAHGAALLVSSETPAPLLEAPATQDPPPSPEPPVPETSERKGVSIQPGRYRHFKGGEYEVIGIARHSETLEEMVVYRALYGERGLWVRPAAMFLETVERDGRFVQRFTRIG